MAAFSVLYSWALEVAARSSERSSRTIFAVDIVVSFIAAQNEEGI